MVRHNVYAPGGYSVHYANTNPNPYPGANPGYCRLALHGRSDNRICSIGKLAGSARNTDPTFGFRDLQYLAVRLVLVVSAHGGLKVRHCSADLGFNRKPASITFKRQCRLSKCHQFIEYKSIQSCLWEKFASVYSSAAHQTKHDFFCM